jgi:integrase
MKNTRIDKEDKRSKTLTVHEVEKILDYYKNRYIGDYAMYFLFFTTALRAFEFCKVRTGDIMIESNPETGNLSFKGKNNKDRFVRLFEEVLDVLNEYYISVGITDDPLEKNFPLFPNQTGKHYNSSYISRRATKGLQEGIRRCHASHYNPQYTSW